MFWRLLSAALALTGCSPREQAPAARAVYWIGAPYRQGLDWVYPQERFSGEETGLAVQLHGRHTAVDGELWDDAMPLAAHATLQLPSVVRVTRLDTGTSITVRVIDRGPPQAGRLLGLSSRAAAMLDMAGRPAPVRIMVDSLRSQVLRDALAGPVHGGMSAAPRTAVLRESLSGGPALRPEPAAVSDEVTALPIPGAPEAGLPAPGQLYVRASTFSQRGPAQVQSGRVAALAPHIERHGTGRAETFTVRAGPYPDVASADAALDLARQAGVTDARIVVE